MQHMCGLCVQANFHREHHDFEYFPQGAPIVFAFLNLRECVTEKNPAPYMSNVQLPNGL